MKKKYITNLEKIKMLSKKLDNINVHIKQKQYENIYYLNEYIRIFNLSNIYVSKIFEQN